MGIILGSLNNIPVFSLLISCFPVVLAIKVVGSGIFPVIFNMEPTICETNKVKNAYLALFFRAKTNIRIAEIDAVAAPK